ncbi:MAG: hypothetical protein HY558_07490, partial [Euryarchaeota archaeon]|nr:hypothetical protein [Euryarchaeota archaeon]
MNPDPPAPSLASATIPKGAKRTAVPAAQAGGGAEERALRIVTGIPHGVLQADLAKKLKLDAQKTAILVARLEARRLIVRHLEKSNGTQVYRISQAPRSDYSLLLAGGKVAPCIGCTLECYPESCEIFTEWIGHLNRAPNGNHQMAPAPA